MSSNPVGGKFVTMVSGVFEVLDWYLRTQKSLSDPENQDGARLKPLGGYNQVGG